jgi:hypothetical protein
LQLKPGTTAAQFATAQLEAGDAVMSRLYEKVKKLKNIFGLLTKSYSFVY